MIYDMINQDERPGYGYQLKKGATSLTEAWDANHHASHNHFMLGHITEWFYKDLVGIDTDPDGAGLQADHHPADAGGRFEVGARPSTTRFAVRSPSAGTATAKSFNLRSRFPPTRRPRCICLLAMEVRSRKAASQQPRATVFTWLAVKAIGLCSKSSPDRTHLNRRCRLRCHMLVVRSGEH